MSVKGVNSDGSASSSNVTIKWSTSSVDTSLTNYTRVPTWDNTISGSVGSNVKGYISSDSDSFTGNTNVIDTLTKYYSTATVGTYMIPSPYAADGSFYSDYVRSISGYNNVLSDFNGAANTNTLAELGSAYAAAYACYLYSTDGIAAGQWYLPAMGELGYMMVRYNIIQLALTACNGHPLATALSYWSSTEYGSSANKGYAYFMGVVAGIINNTLKTGAYYVRPFVSLS